MSEKVLRLIRIEVLIKIVIGTITCMQVDKVSLKISIKIERLRQREERLQRLEEEFAVKEREMERKQFLLQQRLEAKRKLQYTQEHEKEILLREEKLK